ncbi:hypothetical protein ACLOJK_011149 [Asimina triloba]
MQFTPSTSRFIRTVICVRPAKRIQRGKAHQIRPSISSSSGRKMMHPHPTAAQRPNVLEYRINYKRNSVRRRAEKPKRRNASSPRSAAAAAGEDEASSAGSTQTPASLRPNLSQKMYGRAEMSEPGDDEMNELKNKKVRDFEKPFPGCMGRMVNLFDSGPVVPGNRLLTERAHRDGSPLSRGRPHTSKVLDPNGNIMEDKPVAYELKSSSSKKSNGTSMKMLIAQEMSQETSSKQQPPSVVARLMGFDGLPANQLASSMQRSVPEGYTRSSSVKSETATRCQQHENDQLDRYMRNNNLSYAYPQAQPECRDVYEVWQHPHVKGQSRQNGRYHENSTEKKMALVRQKFNEAKRLATDEKLRQSKEFQDAVEVLSSNRDLFLEFLKEPNSLFSKHLYDLQSIPPCPQTNRITVLKPSKTLEMDRCGRPDTKIEKHTKKQQQVVEEDQWDRKKSTWTSFAQQKADNAQPTRIVVLKPSPGKTHDVMAVASSHSSSPRWLHDEDFYRDAGTDETRGSREMAKEITRQMQESLSSSRREETLPSSVLLNGYVGDDSSFNRSENECIEEGNLSDSEIMTPTSRHSWDYINRYSSPFSSSSFSRASYSPESSVTREAKKRLSERLAMMTSTGNTQEQRQIRRSSSTLGEMLALPDKKNAGSAQEGPSTSSSRSRGSDQDPRGPLACFSSSDNRNEGMEDSPRNLSRSRSVPVSSTAYGKVELSDEASDFKSCKPIVQEAKPKSGKSSFRGKVSSLFFSRSKKPNKEKSVPSASARHPEVLPDQKQPSVVQMNSDITECLSDCLFDEGHPSSSVLASSKLNISSSETVLSLSKPGGPMFSSENHDQPSPVSILEAPFEDDVNTSHSSETAIEDYGSEPSARLHHRSGLSAKSPLISVSRSLSWDDDVSEAVTASHPWKPLSPPKRSAVSSNTEEEQRERFLFVQSLLSASGLQHEKPSTVISRWHSAESPLHPSLLECKAWKEEKEQNESICRRRRSERRLLFDSVNAAIREMVGWRSDEISCGMTARSRRDLPGETVEEQVWGQVRVWMSAEAKWFSGEIDMTMVVEGMVRMEVVERGWGELTGPEVDGIGKEIEGKLLNELVEEMLGELTCL